MHAFRYTVLQTCELLASLGIKDVSTFEQNCMNGGDILELTDQEMEEDLALPPLQVRYVKATLIKSTDGAS